MLGDDGLVVVLNIVLGKFPGVFDSAFGQEVHRVGFLEEGIAHVLLVLQDFSDRGIIPLGLSGTGQNPIRLKIPGDGIGRLAFKVLPKNAADDFGFFGNNDKVSVLVLIVA